jgi:crotonobetainyl-CoA:carnitine CoA-transferase CaiB-like acyl-CoA transferase
VAPFERLYETADGWLCIAAEEGEADALASALEIPFGEDERFASASARATNAYELEVLLGDAFATRSTAAWLEALQAAGVPAAEPVPRNGEAFLRDPENQRTHRAAEAPHPTQGRVRGVGVLLRTSDTAVAPFRLAPELGEHSDELLAWLGYDADRIAALRARGSVG